MAKVKQLTTSLELMQPAQFFLFRSWPEEPEVARKAKEYLHTGKIALGDGARCLDIIESILNGASKRAVAGKFKAGRETIDAIFRDAEASGKLRPIKQRLRADWLETVQLTQWRIQEALLANEMPLQVLPMLAGVGTDKIELLTHSGDEDAPQKSINIAADVLRAIVLDVQGAGVTVDCESTAISRNSLAVNGPGLAVGALVADEPPRDCDGLGSGAEAGGGGLPSPATLGGDGSGRENSTPKEGSSAP